MPVEVALGFVLPCFLQRTLSLAEAMLRPVDRGLLFSVPPLSLFTCPAKIDDFTHHDVRMTPDMLTRPRLVPVLCAKYAGTVALPTLSNRPITFILAMPYRNAAIDMWEVGHSSLMWIKNSKVPY